MWSLNPILNAVYWKKSFLSTESDTKILQSIYFAYKVGIISSYSNRIYLKWFPFALPSSKTSSGATPSVFPLVPGPQPIDVFGGVKWCNFLLHLTNTYVCETSMGGQFPKKGPEAAASFSFPNIHSWAWNLSCWQSACDNMKLILNFFS